MLRTIIAAGLMLASGAAAAFDLQGHRGARGLAPENTLPGFRAALAIGVATLELDVGLTADGVLVVHHDSRLNPDTTRGPDGAWITTRPALHGLDAAALAAYDVGRLRPGSDYARNFPDQVPADGARIPPLDAVFALVRTPEAAHVRLNIETKLSPRDADGPAPALFAERLAAAIRAAGLADRVSVQSFDWRTLSALRRIAPEIARVCLTAERPRFNTIGRGQPGPSPWTDGRDVDEVGGSVPRLVAAAGCATWSPHFDDLTAETMREAQGLGLKVVPWTVNDAAAMERVIELGTDGLITDFPDRARAVLAARGMALPAPVAVGR